MTLFAKLGWSILVALLVPIVLYLAYRFGVGLRKGCKANHEVGKYRVWYELRREDDDFVLERGAVQVEATRDFAFSAAAKQVLDDVPHKYRNPSTYVALVTIKEVK